MKNAIFQVQNYKLFAGNGRYIRIATKVTFNGKEIKFIDKMGKKEAIRNVLLHI